MFFIYSAKISYELRIHSPAEMRKVTEANRSHEEGGILSSVFSIFGSGTVPASPPPKPLAIYQGPLSPPSSGPILGRRDSLDEGERENALNPFAA
jgi:hypothetical protein